MFHMSKVYDVLLRHLVMEYNDILLRPVRSRFPSNELGEEFYFWKKREREDEANLDESLSAIEDDILVILALRCRKRRLTVKGSWRRKKRGRYMKYLQYFTDPDTGVCSIMTPQHTVWYQSYILNPKLECKKWQQLFCYRFRMPYQSFLDLVRECERSPIMATWSRLPEYRFNKKKVLPLNCWFYVRYVGLVVAGQWMIYRRTHR